MREKQCNLWRRSSSLAVSFIFAFNDRETNLRKEQGCDQSKLVAQSLALWLPGRARRILCLIMNKDVLQVCGAVYVVLLRRLLCSLRPDINSWLRR